MGVLDFGFWVLDFGLMTMKQAIYRGLLFSLRAIALTLLTGFTLGCQRPNLYETDEVRTTARPPTDTEIRPLAEEVAEYPRAFEAQAIQTVNTLQRAQQAYYLERKRFGSSPDALGIGVELDSDAYTYQIELSDEEPQALIYSIPKFEPLRSYTGIVAVNQSGDRLMSLICESNTHTTTPPTPTITNRQFVCPNGTQGISDQ